MKAKWAASVCAIVLVLGQVAIRQENGSSNYPVRNTRPPADSRDTTAPQQVPVANSGRIGSPAAYGAPPNAIPDGSRFIIKLKDNLDTRKMEAGQHVKGEIRE